MPGPGGHGGPGGGGGGHRGGPGGMGRRPGGMGGRPGGMGGHPGMGGMGHMGHQPPPPHRRWGWSGGYSPYGRGCCGCFLPVIGIAAIVVGALALLLL